MKKTTKNQKRSVLKLTALIMAHGLAGSSHGAEATNAVAAANAGTNTLPTVVVRGQADSYKAGAVANPKYTEPLRDTPQTIHVIPQSVMQDQGATTLRDVLRNVPGISMQAGEGGVPNGDNLSIRGFSARTDIFVDGMRDIGGYTRDPFNIEQAEVYKGPSSAMSGRGSTGGSINLITKSPHAVPSYEASVGLGTDDFKRTAVDVNQPLEKLGLESTAVRVNAMWTDSEVAGRDYVDNSRWGVAPSIVFGLGKPARLTLQYLHQDQDNTPDYGIPWVPGLTPAKLAAYGLTPANTNNAAPVSFHNFYGLKSDYEKVTTDIFTTRAEYDLNDAVSFHNQLRFDHNYRDSVITAPRFNTAASNTVANAMNRQLQSRDMTDTMLGDRVDMAAKFDTGPIRHSLVSGVELSHETSDNYARGVKTNGTFVGGSGATAPYADLYHPNPGNLTRYSAVQRTGAYTSAESDSVGIDAFDTIKVGEHWEFHGGTRLDYFELNAKSVATNGAAYSLGRIDKLASWNGAVVFKPVEQGSVYFAYGTSFNPSGEGLTLATNFTGANNVTVSPEKSQTFEIGTKWDLFERRLSVGAALFRTDKINARTEDPTDANDVVVLQGEQQVEGFELNAQGSITENWKAIFGYTHMDSEVKKSKNPAEVGQELSNTPRDSMSLWTTYNFPHGIQAGVGTSYTGERVNSTIPATTRTAPEYWLFDAMVSYQATKNLTLRLNVYNLADEEYIDRVGGGHFVPGAGRSAVLTASLKF